MTDNEDTPPEVPPTPLTADEAIYAVVRKMRAGALLLFRTDVDNWVATAQVILQDVQNTAELWEGARDIKEDLRGAPGNLYDLDAKWRQQLDDEDEANDLILGERNTEEEE